MRGSAVLAVASSLPCVSMALPRTPELVLNGALGWENNNFGVRFAATYRDKALMGFEELDGPAFDVFQASGQSPGTSPRACN